MKTELKNDILRKLRDIDPSNFTVREFDKDDIIKKNLCQYFQFDALVVDGERVYCKTKNALTELSLMEDSQLEALRDGIRTCMSASSIAETINEKLQCGQKIFILGDIAYLLKTPTIAGDAVLCAAFAVCRGGKAYVEKLSVTLTLDADDLLNGEFCAIDAFINKMKLRVYEQAAATAGFLGGDYLAEIRTL